MLIKNMQKILNLVIFLSIIALTGIIAFYSDEITKTFGNYSYIGIFILSFLGSASLFIPLGSLQLTVVLVAKGLNPILSAIIAGVGSGIGESTGYIFGKESKELINTKDMNKLKWFLKLQKGIIKKYELAGIFILALMPNPVFDFVGIYCGLRKIDYKIYLVLTILGRIIRYFILIYFGQMITNLY
jgi:membrane protein YqaA with SNARE-associated domain